MAFFDVDRCFLMLYDRCGLGTTPGSIIFCCKTAQSFLIPGILSSPRTPLPFFSYLLVLTPSGMLPDMDLNTVSLRLLGCQGRSQEKEQHL